MPSPTANPQPGRAARVLLTATIAGAAYLDFFSLKASGFSAPNALDAVLHGQATAPEQYRMGVLWLAHTLSVHLHLALPFTLAAIDALCGLVAVLTLFRIFERSATYTHATTPTRWLGVVTFVLLIHWFLAWLLWLPKPETLPTAMLLALMLALWQPRQTTSTARQLATAAAILVLTLLLCTLRTDVACLLNAGIFLFVLAQPEAKLALRRPVALATSAVSALSAAAIQLWLAHVAYPQATYGNVKLWQLRPNLIHASRWPPFVIFLLPLAWMLVQLARRRSRTVAVSLAFLTGAALYFALWFTIGKIDEVRIFLPFAFALTPLTAQLAMLRAESSSEDLACRETRP
jgi:hypothetical protein